VRAEIGVRVHHRVDEGAKPILPLAISADRFAAGIEFGAVRAVLEGVPVAARGANLRCARSFGRQARFLAVFPAVRILLAGFGTCAAFGKIIVPCAIEGGTPSRCVLALTLRQAQGEGLIYTRTLHPELVEGLKGAATTNGTQFRLRQDAGRVRTRKGKRLHGAHYKPAQRSVDKLGEGGGSA